MKRLLVDLSPLRSSRPFAALWSGTSLIGVGAQIAIIAVLAQMWSITQSALWTGTIGLTTAAAVLIVGPLGGNLADRHDRRNMVRTATLAQVLTALGLVAQAAAGNDSPLLLLALVAVNAASGALGAPARRALPPRLLPAEKLGGAYALLNLSFQVSMLVGPALGGVLVAWSLSAAYAAQFVSALLSLITLAFMPRVPPTPGPSADAGRAAGWSVVLRKPTISGAFATDVAATALAMPIAVFPVLNELYFDSDPRTLGLFFSAIATGGILAGLLSGTIARARRLGTIMIIAALAWSLSIALFGISHMLCMALVLLGIAGAADTIAVIARGVLIQIETPDDARGRVSAAEQVVGVASPELGNFRGGLIATAIGGPASVVIGGATAFVAIAAIALSNRPVREYETSPLDPP